VINLNYGTSGDRAYYFVERRSSITGPMISDGAYVKLERLN